MHSVLKSNQIAQHVVSDVGKAKQNGTAGRQKNFEYCLLMHSLVIVVSIFCALFCSVKKKVHLFWNFANVFSGKLRFLEGGKNLALSAFMETLGIFGSLKIVLALIFKILSIFEILSITEFQAIFGNSGNFGNFRISVNYRISSNFLKIWQFLKFWQC